MKLSAAVVAVLLLGGCGESRQASPENATVASPAIADIPSTAGRSAGGDGDMRVLEPHTSDLDGMIERGVIRLLVVPGRTHFDTAGGVQRGRTVDAAVAFEQFVNQRIAPRTISVVLTPSSEASIVADLLGGQGDAAANVLLTFERDEQVAFASPMRAGIRELVVTGPGQPPLVSLEDVGGRTIHVQRDSDHHASLLRLNAQLTSINRPPAKVVLTDATSEELLAMVDAGKAPATLAYDYVLDVSLNSLPRLASNRDVAVSQDVVLAWVTRKDATKLLGLINEFFAAHRLTF